VAGGPSVDELRALLAAAGTGTWQWDARSGVVEWDETMEALAGLPPGGFESTYEAWLATLHSDEVDGILAKVQAAIEVLGPYHFEHRAMWPDGTSRWLDCRGQVTSDEDGNFSGTIGCAVDVTDRHRTEAASLAAFDRERRLRDRLEFLVQITDTALVATHHLQFMRDVAAAAVPRLGDWCSIHFQPETGAPFEVVVAHADPARVEWADALSKRFPYDPDGIHGIPLVIRTGRSEFIERVTGDVIDAALERSAFDPDEVRSVLDVLGLTSVITVPLATARGTIGAMQFVTAESGRTYEHDDVRLAEVAAGRVADALDNMWLTGQHRHISATLQRALLPPMLPEIDGIDLAVRYWPAGSAVAAGGDFYDVFATSESTWSLLIGDVCGTGPDAAALTGITRHTVRAAARHGQDHRSVLEWLNEAMRLSNRDRFCTAVYATLTSEPAGGWRLSSCAAGHPRPIIVRADGRSELHGPHGSLLGVFEEIDVEVAHTTLEAGDTVVFYTDGITDLRPPHARTEAELAELVANLVDGNTAEGLAEAIHTVITDELESDDRGDDIALLVLRVGEI
jgi:serine phosphatase RsbU (regulator of sigma subunit)